MLFLIFTISSNWKLYNFKIVLQL